MEALNSAGIYVAIDLATPYAALSSTSPSWNVELLTDFINTVEAFGSYENVFGFTIGNEVVSVYFYLAIYVSGPRCVHPFWNEEDIVRPFVGSQLRACAFLVDDSYMTHVTAGLLTGIDCGPHTFGGSAVGLFLPGHEIDSFTLGVREGLGTATASGHAVDKACRGAVVGYIAFVLIDVTPRP